MPLPKWYAEPWCGAGVIALAFFSVCIAAACFASRAALPLTMAINALGCCYIAMILRSNERIVLPSFDRGAEIIMCGGLALYLQFLIRLMFATGFGGSIANMDFGLKCNEDGTSCTDNTALQLEFNSFAHCLQGCLSVLFFPSLGQIVSKCLLPVATRNIIVIKDGLALLVFAYPTYNLCKRGSYHSSSFASSSFSSNGAEWATGFLFGFVAGMAVENWAHRGKLLDPLQSVTYYRHFFPFARIAIGMVLTVVAIVNGILCGLTWHNRPSENSPLDPNPNDEIRWTAGEFKSDFISPGILVLFVGIPVALEVALVLKWLKQKPAIPMASQHSDTGIGVEEDMSESPCEISG
jgi:hypothetical protein